jgi:hypothetical protein
MSMLASKLPRTSRLPLARASTNSEFAISQRLPVEANSTPSEARLSQAGSHAGIQAGSQVGNRAGFQLAAGSLADSQQSCVQ